MPSHFDVQYDGLIGEGWSGTDPDGAHVNVVLAERGSATAAALLTTFTSPAPGHAPILVVVGEDKDHYEPVWPPTIMINKETALEPLHQKITWGAGQLGIAQGVLDAVAEGLIPCSGDLLVFVAIYIDPGAGDETAVRVGQSRGDIEGRAHCPSRPRRCRAGTGRAPGYGHESVLLRQLTSDADHADLVAAPDAAAGAAVLRRLGPRPPDPVRRDDRPRPHRRGPDRDRLGRHDGWLRDLRRTCSSAPTRSGSPPTGGRWRRSRFTPVATGRWRPRLWDLAGQALGVPMATLLGGAADRIPAYASLGELRSPRAARAGRPRAWSRPASRPSRSGLRADRIAEGIAVVAAIRDAVDDALEIMVDLNQWWRMAGDIEPGLTPQGARAVIERLREHDVLWVEEPLAGDDLAGMRMLREQTGVRISGGEMARTFDELRTSADRRGARRRPARRRALAGDRRRPDPGRAGAAPQPLVHATHLDQRDRAAGQPARLLRRRRRAVPRVPLRPAGLDDGPARLHARRADRGRRRWVRARAGRSRARNRARRGADQPLRGARR